MSKSTKSLVSSHLKLRLEYDLERLQRIKAQAKKAGFHGSPEWHSALDLIEVRIEQIYFNLRYHRTHHTKALRDIILAHVRGLITEMEEMMSGLSKFAVVRERIKSDQESLFTEQN